MSHLSHEFQLYCDLITNQCITQSPMKAKVTLHYPAGNIVALIATHKLNAL